MRRARQPLSQADDVFEPGFPGGDRKGDRALNHVGIERRTKIGTLDVLQRVGHSLDITHVGDRNLGPLRLQVRAAAIFLVYQCPDGIAGFQQFDNDDATSFPARAGYDDSWLDHNRLLIKVVPSCSSAPMGVTAALPSSMPSAA